jgi:ABC-2 type transport system ATP-binding protein
VPADPRPHPETGAAVRVTGLVKRFGSLVAVDGLDLEVRTGECFGLLGPNGAGKTTSIEILEGLQRQDAGEVELLGIGWGRGRDHELRQRIGVQLQETKLGEKLTVEETARMFRSFYPSGRTVADIISTVQLEEKADARVGKLSGGQRQRLAVACALVGDPDVLFLDEPTTGLDPQARLQLWDIVERFKAGGGTVLLTTHYMDEAARLCDRIAIMDRGRVIALGTPEELIRSLGAEQIVDLRVAGELDAAPLRALPGVTAVRERDGVYALSVSDIAAALPALMTELHRRGLPIETLTTHQATLEDVFVRMTGRHLRDA